MGIRPSVEEIQPHSPLRDARATIIISIQMKLSNVLIHISTASFMLREFYWCHLFYAAIKLKQYGEKLSFP